MYLDCSSGEQYGYKKQARVGCFFSLMVQKLMLCFGAGTGVAFVCRFIYMHATGQMWIHSSGTIWLESSFFFSFFLFFPLTYWHEACQVDSNPRVLSVSASPAYWDCVCHHIQLLNMGAETPITPSCLWAEHSTGWAIFPPIKLIVFMLIWKVVSVGRKLTRK